MSMWFQIYTSLLQTKYTADSQRFQNSAGRLRVGEFPAPGLDCGYFADVTEKLNWIISSSAKSVATLTRVAKTRTFIIHFRNVKVQAISFDPQRSTTLQWCTHCSAAVSRRGYSWQGAAGRPRWHQPLHAVLCPLSSARQQVQVTSSWPAAAASKGEEIPTGSHTGGDCRHTAN